MIVSIIGVIFLAITLGSQDVSKETSVEISNLLEATMYHTTDCAVNFVPQYRDMQDLIKECYNMQTGNFRQCLDGRSVCEVLESDLGDIMRRSLNAGEDSPNKAYIVNVFFNDDSNPIEPVLIIQEGVLANCTSIVGGSHQIPVSSFGFGKIETELVVCKN